MVRRGICNDDWPSKTGEYGLLYIGNKYGCYMSNDPPPERKSLLALSRKKPLTCVQPVSIGNAAAGGGDNGVAGIATFSSLFDDSWVCRFRRLRYTKPATVKTTRAAATRPVVKPAINPTCCPEPELLLLLLVFAAEVIPNADRLTHWDRGHCPHSVMTFKMHLSEDEQAGVHSALQLPGRQLLLLS